MSGQIATRVPSGSFRCVAREMRKFVAGLTTTRQHFVEMPQQLRTTTRSVSRFVANVLFPVVRRLVGSSRRPANAGCGYSDCFRVFPLRFRCFDIKSGTREIQLHECDHPGIDRKSVDS